ncbi:hypothetical protein GLA29479_470 [Lysobacter antibioticus]|nr:hypothetical protein GLA29479_470 [Lysobacter antibioticus]
MDRTNHGRLRRRDTGGIPHPTHRVRPAPCHSAWPDAVGRGRPIAHMACAIGGQDAVAGRNTESLDPARARSQGFAEAER